MYVDQQLRRLLVRYRGRILFDYSGPQDVCCLSARRDGSADDDWVYVSFTLPPSPEDSYDRAVIALRGWLTMPQARYDKEYPKDSN
jgi:hypothetical protein